MSPAHLRRFRSGVLLLAAPALVAGCGAASSATAVAPHPASPVTSAAAASVAPAVPGLPSSCAGLGAARVAAVLGEALTTGQEQRLGPVLVCTYRKGKNERAVTVRFAPLSSAASFAAARDTFTASNQKPQTVHGFYDQAYRSSFTALGVTTRTLVARKGSLEILVVAQASLAREEKLISTLFSA